MTKPVPLEDRLPEVAEGLQEFIQYNDQRIEAGLPRLICDCPNGTIRIHPKDALNAPDIGRNNPCPCGSGKKYKKCCGFWR